MTTDAGGRIAEDTSANIFASTFESKGSDLMALAFYMDHNVPSSITNGLRIRGVDVMTAYEDGTHVLADAAFWTEHPRCNASSSHVMMTSWSKPQDSNRQGFCFME